MTRSLTLPAPHVTPLDELVLTEAAACEAAGRTRVGGKAFNLARLEAAGVPVPPWLVVLADAFDAYVASALPEGAGPGGEAVQAWVRALALPPAFVDALRAALFDRFAPGSRLAVRSSAAAEDGQAHSFAGQFDTVLGVPLEDDLGALLDALRRVWASAFHAHALAYAGAARPRMAVLVQAMVDPAVSGVAFAADPVDGRRDTVVASAVYGLGEGLVSGELDADTYRVRDGDGAPVERQLAAKDRALRLRPGGGTAWEPLPPGLRAAPTLSDAEVRALARACRRLEAAFGTPQDVEWALDGARRLVFLQARPITTMREDPAGNALPDGSPPPAPEGRHVVWDNSNIVESYSGVTTPLTFSFAREVYESVYRQFCGLMGVPAAVVREQQPVFAHLLGCLRGRVYYNLLNWYRVLSLLPGFSVNRGFMERMMGVRQKLEAPPEPPYVAGRWEDLGRLARMVARMLREQARLKHAVPAFHAHVDGVLRPLAKEELAAWPSDALIDLYRRLERQLLDRWQTPLVNDFFAMIWFGVLGRMVEGWMPAAPPSLVNDLLCGEGGMVSTEPARQVMRLAAHVAAEPSLRALFPEDADPADVWARLTRDGAFAAFTADVRAYLDRFGDRCMNELKLETVTLSENPAFLMQMIGTYARAGVTDPDAGVRHEREVRARAEALVRQSLSGPRHALFVRVLRQARRRVRDRENLRFERTRVFGIVRRLFVALAGHLVRQGALAHPSDVFYLTREELFGYFEGTLPGGGLDRLAALRRADYAAFEREGALPDRIETWGPPLPFLETLPARAAATGGETLQGLGCSPGVVRAPVRVVRDPREATGLTGTILVAERTDPGWTLLFPAVRGLLVERGSLLSHSAIVAREMALPCIVALPGLLDTLTDGEVVEMDGTTGTVRRAVAESGARRSE